MRVTRVREACCSLLLNDLEGSKGVLDLLQHSTMPLQGPSVTYNPVMCFHLFLLVPFFKIPLVPNVASFFFFYKHRIEPCRFCSKLPLAMAITGTSLPVNLEMSSSAHPWFLHGDICQVQTVLTVETMGSLPKIEMSFARSFPWDLAFWKIYLGYEIHAKAFPAESVLSTEAQRRQKAKSRFHGREIGTSFWQWKTHKA